MRSLFVTASIALGSKDKPNGGVQICTHEYLAVLRKAGFEISVLEFEGDQRLTNRLVRKLWRRPYHNFLPPDLGEKVAAAVVAEKAEVVFLNLIDVAPLAKEIRQQLGPKVKIILLSHGLGCADILHDIRISSLDTGTVGASPRELRWLAGHLIEECDQRKYIDHVFCLSEFDVGLERWVGTRSVSWLPRIVPVHSLLWKPVYGRVGFVGTLDHSPNWEGILLFLRAIERSDAKDIRVRIVGGPERRGLEVARQFTSVDYLGPMDDRGLETEAATWMCAIHPLFCYSRGCSTKLAILLGWRIPVLTTPQGCRGYSWIHGEIPLAEGPEALVELAAQMKVEKRRVAIRNEIVRAADSSPTLDEVANKVRVDLSSLFCDNLNSAS